MPLLNLHFFMFVVGQQIERNPLRRTENKIFLLHLCIKRLQVSCSVVSQVVLYIMQAITVKKYFGRY